MLRGHASCLAVGPHALFSRVFQEGACPTPAPSELQELGPYYSLGPEPLPSVVALGPTAWWARVSALLAALGASPSCV